MIRCLAFAVKTDLGQFGDYTGESHPAHKLLLDPANYDSIETDLTWLGVAGLQDPPRPEVSKAIKECKNAGIEVRIHQSTQARFGDESLQASPNFSVFDALKYRCKQEGACSGADLQIPKGNSTLRESMSVMT